MQFAQSVGSRFTNRADFEFIQVTDLAICLFEPLEEILYAVHAREDKPVITVEMFDGFIQKFITFEFANFYSGAEQYACTISFKFGNKLVRLILSASNHDGAAREGTVQCKFGLCVVHERNQLFQERGQARLPDL